MVQIKDAYLSTDDFGFQVNREGIVQMSFGPTHICMSVDSALDLQYRLAAFLAHLEMKEYLDEEEDESFAESKETLKSLSSRHLSKKLDA